MFKDHSDSLGHAAVASEWNTKPHAILIHDPTPTGAVARLNGKDVGSRFLFRSAPDPILYAQQHAALAQMIRNNTKKIFYLNELIDVFPEWVSRNPNLVFTRDSLVTFPWLPRTYLPARMREEVRREEPALLEEAVRKLGLEPMLRLPEHLFLEGGDVIPFSRDEKRILFVGYGTRTHPDTVPFLRKQLIPEAVDELVAVELAPWRLNLDGGFVPVSANLAIVDSESLLSARLFDAEGSRRVDFLPWLESIGVDVIAVTREESVHAQACNCVCLGDGQLIYYDLCTRVSQLLSERGFVVHRVPGSELVKGRGGPRCMTRPIYTPVMIDP